MKPPLIKFLNPGIIQHAFPWVIWHGNHHLNHIFITFDDGPHPEHTPEVLDILKQYNIKATFFCEGRNILKNSDLMKQIVQEGHIIGNHAYNHISLAYKNKTSIIKEISDTHEAIKTTTGISANLFRPPYGHFNPTIKTILHRLNYQMVVWDLLTYDFSDKNPANLIKRTIKHIKPGSILVFHDGHHNAPIMIKALPKILDHVEQIGFTPKPLSSDFLK